MAYGMSSSELARVGRDVNKQGGGVDEQSIQDAMDRELSEDRKQQVGKFKSRKSEARVKDAEQKAALKNNIIKAVVESGIEGVQAAEKQGAFEKSDEAKMASAQRKEARLTAKADRKAAKTEQFRSKLGPDGGTKRQKRRLAGMEKRTKGAQTKAIRAGVGAQKLSDRLEIGQLYKNQGSLYGTKGVKLMSDKEIDALTKD